MSKFSCVLFGIACFLLACAFTYCIQKHFLCKQKRYQHFICHHQGGTGAFTRLLKTHGVENPQVIGGVTLVSGAIDMDTDEEEEIWMSRQGEEETAATRVVRSARATLYMAIGSVLSAMNILIVLSRLLGENLQASVWIGQVVQTLRETLQALQLTENHLERVEAVSTRSRIIHLRAPPPTIHSASINELDAWMAEAQRQRDRLMVLREAFLDTQP